MNRTEVLKRLNAFPKDDVAAAFAVGISLIRADYAEPLLPHARALAERFPREARAQQLVGLAARIAQESGLALEAFAAAAAIAPTDALIAHSHARAALEAGRPAVALFERSIRLAPQDGSARLGLAAALLHEGRAEDAVELLDALLSASPEWIEGHRDAAHVRGQLGLDPYSTISAALAKFPRSGALHNLHAVVRLEALDLPGATAALDAARHQIGDQHWINLLAAHTASEQGLITQADSLFAKVNARATIGDTSLLARHLLRAGREESVDEILQPLIAQDYDHLLWPYLSLAWRLTSDERWDWLEGDSGLVGVYDLSEEIGDFDAVAEQLRQLHFAKEQPLDQSVRGGTQTDGNLLLRTEETIQRLKRAILDVVHRHAEQLPPWREGHPTCLSERDPLRIAGSWSVRLRDAGFHSDHVHSKGWISSALYVHLPETMAETSSPERTEHAGWLSLGECRDVLPGLEPVRLIEPKIGRLVLFPSTMWHGTRPFSRGERMTLAFDIARPKQSGTQ